MTVVIRAVVAFIHSFALLCIMLSSAWAKPIDTVKETRIGPSSPYSYTNDHTWKKLQTFLPAQYHMTDKQAPAESLWQWQNFQIHVERYARPSSPVKIILLHGVGTNSRQLSMIVGRPLAQAGYETIALDMPPYGYSQYTGDKPIIYDDWVNTVIRFVQYEQQRDKRPIILYGLSAGGMLAYHVTAKYPHIAGIIGMTFLDQRLPSVRDITAKNWLISRVGSPAAESTAHSAIGKIHVPMRWVSKMDTLVNNEDALKIMLADPHSAGNEVSIKFLSSYLYYRPAIEPQAFTVCPILLTQPANDRWTPLELSAITLRKIRLVPVKIVQLPGAGHFPLEKEGLDALQYHMIDFIKTIVASR